MKYKYKKSENNYKLYVNIHHLVRIHISTLKKIGSMLKYLIIILVSFYRSVSLVKISFSLEYERSRST